MGGRCRPPSVIVPHSEALLLKQNFGNDEGLLPNPFAEACPIASRAHQAFWTQVPLRTHPREYTHTHTHSRTLSTHMPIDSRHLSLGTHHWFFPARKVLPYPMPLSTHECAHTLPLATSSRAPTLLLAQTPPWPKLNGTSMWSSSPHAALRTQPRTDRSPKAHGPRSPSSKRYWRALPLVPPHLCSTRIRVRERTQSTRIVSPPESTQELPSPFKFTFILTGGLWRRPQWRRRIEAALRVDKRSRLKVEPSTNPPFAVFLPWPVVRDPAMPSNPAVASRSGMSGKPSSSHRTCTVLCLSSVCVSSMLAF